METLSILLALLSAVVALFIPALLFPTRFMRWFKLKRYQYEVTFSLYMLTPTEKFILNSFVFLTLSMIIIAASLYLPEHIITMSHRAFYYWSGYSRNQPSQAARFTSMASATATSLASNVADSTDSIAIQVAKAAGTGAERIGEYIAEGSASAAGVLDDL